MVSSGTSSLLSLGNSPNLSFSSPVSIVVVPGPGAYDSSVSK
jgi:hypothetical protein